MLKRNIKEPCNNIYESENAYEIRRNSYMPKQ